MFRLTRLSLEAATEAVNRAEAAYMNKPDFVDKGIEPNIRPVVIALVAHGFPTQNSCEGHLGLNLYPWIRLEPDISDNPTRDEVLEHLKRIHYEHDQLSELVGDFWQHSPPPSADRELRATLEWEPRKQSDEEVADEYLAELAQHFVAPPGYWLQCRDAEILTQLPGELLEPYKEQILANRQQDMLDFAEYLRSKL
jgi:hypothetical protein